MLLTENNTIYTGFTTDVERRFCEHKGGVKHGGAKYTKANKPIKIIFKKEFSTKSDAMKEEYRIKHLKRSEKLKLATDNIN